jgi:DNA-binding transcriptional MerR regulator
MPEEKDPNLTSHGSCRNRRKDLEEALAAWEEVGTELKKLLTGLALDEFSIREIASKCEKLLSVVYDIEVEVNRYPEKQYYNIDELCEVLNMDRYVLRYWESEFKILHPRTRARQRLYHRKDIERVELIKHLLWIEKFTIAGAKARLRAIDDEDNKRRAAEAAIEGHGEKVEGK